VLRVMIGLAFVATLVVGPAMGVLASSLDDVDFVAQETPYEAPDIQGVDTPSWLRPLEPLARLPLWGQAAVLSAGVAGLFLVVPMVGRWVWRLGEGRGDSELDDGTES
jgi:hypothetical protein